jgi:hydrogenase expression/formation protein HypE
MIKEILLSHGSGGKHSHELIRELFVKYFDNPTLANLNDSASLGICPGELVFTTDSYVVDPIFFPGGDIGKLAVCGTINDLAVTGADPLYMSAGFILEAGLPMTDLEKIVQSMAAEAKKAGIQIVTGDTKVVDKGKADKLFINTSGVGFLRPKSRAMYTRRSIKSGDKIMVNGNIGDHGVAVLSAREQLNVASHVVSDCASLNRLIAKVLNNIDGVRFMRDLTRGGLATILCEVCDDLPYGIEIEEPAIPFREEVKGVCEMLGMEPMYMANEGKFITIVEPGVANKLLSLMQTEKLGQQAAIIGEIVEDHPGKVVMNTEIGGTRFIDMLTGEQLPRIC